jgi:hypothetical protein
VATDVVGQKSIEVGAVSRANPATGLHHRPGGAACVHNGDCASEFCDATLKVCVELCSQDSTCPLGMTCDPIYLQTSAASLTPNVTWGRACVNASFGDLVSRM